MPPNADPPRKRRKRALAVACLGAFGPIVFLTLPFLLHELPLLRLFVSGQGANSTLPTTEPRPYATGSAVNATGQIIVTGKEQQKAIMLTKTSTHITVSPTQHAQVTTTISGDVIPNTTAGSTISDTEAKLKYLSLVYNEQVADAALFDGLEIIYRNTSVGLPLHMIPCIVFAYGHNCEKFWKRKCGHGRRSESSQDLTLVAEVNWPTRKNIVEDNEWLEVTRWGMPEGNGYGCFFNVRKGSGVFVNTKRTIVVQNDTDAKITFQMPLKATGAAYCPHAREQGYDTIQVVNAFDGNSNQLIYCTGTCATEPVLTACVDGLEFRTGINHDKPCECDDDISLINCGNAIAPKGKQHICDQKWTDDSTGSITSSLRHAQTVYGGGKIAVGKLGLG